MRTCPHCLTQTEDEHCPKDGFGTIASDKYVAPHHELVEGHTINKRYKIREKIGAGGFGSVYKGLNLAMDQTVAIKVLRLDPGPDKTDQVRRFHREALSSSKLHHPNTIKVFDFGQSEEGFLFMVMEFVSGGHLLKVIREAKTLSASRTIGIIRQVLRSLCEAHEKGIVHRDIKPENILLSSHAGVTDFVKVLDFGIAKVLSSDSGQSSMTAKGMLFGSPTYMSPEQIRGQGVDHRTDLYAVGAVIYHCLVGRPPFVAETPMSILYAHVNEPVPPLPPTAGGEPIPRALAQLVERLLSKRPEDRPASSEAALELLNAIDIDAVGATLPRLQQMGTDGLALGPTMELQRGDGTDFTSARQDESAVGVLIAVIAAVLLLVGGGGAAWYFNWGPGVSSPPKESPTEQASQTDDPTGEARDQDPAGTETPEPTEPAPAPEPEEAPEVEPAPPEPTDPRVEEPAGSGTGEPTPEAPPTPPVEPTPEAAPTPPPVPEPVVEPVVEPVSVTLVASKPASVFEGEKLLGRTPLMLKEDPSEAPRHFRLVPDDQRYKETEQVVSMTQDAVVQVRFERNRRQTTRPPRPDPRPSGPRGPREVPVID